LLVIIIQNNNNNIRFYESAFAFQMHFDLCVKALFVMHLFECLNVDNVFLLYGTNVS